MDITLEEIIDELGKNYNKELTICVQNLQIKKLELLVNAVKEEDSDNDEKEE